MSITLDQAGNSMCLLVAQTEEELKRDVSDLEERVGSVSLPTLQQYGDAILNGPDWSSYEFNETIHSLRMVIEAYVFHRPWIEGMAACAVGVESVVPAIFGRIGKACINHYGLAPEHAEWFEIHGGEVEMEHGNEGLRVLEKYVAADDLDTQAGCIAAASLIAKGVGIGLFNEVATW